MTKKECFNCKKINFSVPVPNTEEALEKFKNKEGDDWCWRVKQLNEHGQWKWDRIVTTCPNVKSIFIEMLVSMKTVNTILVLGVLNVQTKLKKASNPHILPLT